MMAKNKQRPHPVPRLPQPQQRAPAQLVLGYDPAGKIDPVDVVSSKEGWSEYTLADGTTIRAKAVMLDVKRAADQYSPDNNPIYVMQFAVVNQLKEVPDRLKKPD